MAASTFPISLPESASFPAVGCKHPQSPSKRSQADAVARAQTGDHEAFSEIYERHKKRVFSICMRIVRDFALAEDLSQETFLQVHRKIGSFRGDSDFTTWLHRLAVNTVLMHMRKRVLPVVSLDHMMTEVQDERAGRDFGARDLFQAGVIDRLTIDRALSTLAPGYRCIYILHDVEGFNHGEIASMQDCTCGNSKSQLHKARRALRGTLSRAGRRRLSRIGEGAVSLSGDCVLTSRSLGPQVLAFVARRMAIRGDAMQRKPARQCETVCITAPPTAMRRIGLLRDWMDFQYFLAPAVFLLAGILVVTFGVRHLRSLKARFSSGWVRVLDWSILSLLLLGSLGLAVSAGINAVALLRLRAINPPQEEILLVNGRRMHLHCMGSGSPTIILDAGLGNDALIWGGVHPQLATTTRVCSYDRAGFGWSEPQPGPRDADHIAGELHQLLRQANVVGPFVLMGHSIAGMYIRDYAARFPEDVAGLIFVDGSTPLQDENPALKGRRRNGPGAEGLDPDVAVGCFGRNFTPGRDLCAADTGFDAQAGHLLAEDLCYPRFSSIDSELDSFNASGHETVHTGPFGALPVLIFSQDPARALSQKHPPRQMVEMEAAWGQMQEDLKKLSSRSRRIIARGSSHAVQIDRPDLLQKEVPLFIEQIRGAAPQPADYGATVVE